MQTPNNTQKHRGFLILITLVLCVSFLISLEYFRAENTIEPVIAQAEPKSTPAPLAATAPATSPTPSPTISPTATPEEKPLAQSTFWDDPYPELYGDNPEQIFLPSEEKIIYLTFDDGPSDSTPMLLDVLKEEGVPATFFVAGKGTKKRELLKRIYEENHTIGVHTLTHEYKYIYQSLENYLADFCGEYYEIWDATGYRPRIFRFPGGSANSHNKKLYDTLIWEMNRRGFVYFDWNVTSEDAVGVEDPKEQLAELLTQSENKQRIIALLHDSEQNPEIGWVVREYIHHMREAGYQFRALDSSVQPIRFPRLS